MQDISGKEVDPTPAPITWATGEPALIASGPFEGSPVTIVEVRGKVALVEGFVLNAQRQIGVHIKQLIKPPAVPRT